MPKFSPKKVGRKHPQSNFDKNKYVLNNLSYFKVSPFESKYIII